MHTCNTPNSVEDPRLFNFQVSYQRRTVLYLGLIDASASSSEFIPYTNYNLVSCILIDSDMPIGKKYIICILKKCNLFNTFFFF